MARKRRGRHNTGGGRQPRQKLFDLRREAHFKYDAKEILALGEMEVGEQNAFVQMLISRGSRGTLAEAKAFVEDKAAEDVIGGDEAKRLVHLLDRYSTYR